ncbi:transcription-repair coupling factor [Auraticoccus monumenti]|uniref:Transcription-repair-coupling factor n=1 Tax=Auraticoccus monumenti TaxID=675864 RepID=A0A1G6YV65_9ACTN|nr:transcription-repair coupling factor [Auraticoccus monumenti]SDD93527.1 transcription-repair coupling factor [Auraticoccus monumenti]
MTLAGLVQHVATDPVIAESIEDARTRGADVLDLTVAAPLRPLVAAALAERSGRPLLLVTSTYREAEDLSATLGSFLDPGEVAYYPAWETLPHERLSPRSDTVGRRLHVLRRVTGQDEEAAPRVVVAPIRSMIQPQVRGLADLRPVRVVVGEDTDPDDLVKALVAAAYSRVDMVERRGEFAVRGGIVDLFPPTLEHPVRIDFFGDTVEEIRLFAVADQRSGEETLPSVVAQPCRELLLTEDVRGRAAALVSDQPELAEMLSKIADGQAVEGMESLSPVLVDGMELLVEVMPADTLVVVQDPELVRTRAHDLVRTSDEFLHASWAGAAGGGAAPIDLGESAYRSLADVRACARDRGQGWWSFSSFNAGPEGGDGLPVRTEDGEIVDLSASEGLASVPTRSVDARAIDSWQGDTEAMVAEVARGVRAGWRIVMTAEGHGLIERMREVLNDSDISARVLDGLPDVPEEQVVSLVTSELRHGFRMESTRLAVLTAGDLSGQRAADKSQRRMPARRKNQIDPLQLVSGDAVVHEQHGVGRYVEMVQRTAGGATREYLVIEYAPSKRGQPGDRLYVPMDQLDLVTRYVGGESPTLDKMGGADWSRRKTRARKAVRQIAGELIQLYAARQATRGHAFSADTTWQRELEDAFGFVETPDQLATIEEVKKDMEQIIPMDRLICGDVGYGKTEIAVRAAFKAVQDGKQVAVLVPTTLLVQQHTQTFAERYAGFPVTVAPISRFQSDAETKATLAGLAAGSVDVVVGTHRLLSGEVKFKDLGLVVVDEEQRFGVEHKEALKRLRTHVDVLAMSATPIPRTLEMAVTGIREMSTIATPPEERHPVLTFAGPYDRGQVAAAIRRELSREGQVFYIHNRVQSIDRTAEQIRELVPEARVVTAHGQMGEARLEQVMIDFWERRADVLVCTTIVEAGLDISSANTLLIERSDLLGLSQLHQLRGRVGRGRERGYAYFLYPPDKPLTETAHDRLATMAAHTDLGAGMQIAMKDLEIRGAGNMLGGEQSGHIADVGFDLYIRLVGEAVADYRGDGGEPEPEMRIELPVEAHLPVDYIESERLRLEMYRRIAEVRSQEDITAIVAELRDRYGAPGGSVLTLLEVARFRLLARAAGLTEVVSQGNYVRFGPFELPESRVLRLKRLHPGSVIKETAGFVLVPRPRASLGQAAPTGEQLLQWCNQVVRDVFAGEPVAA